MKTVMIEDCERLQNDFREYTKTAEQHELGMLGIVEIKLHETLERYRKAGKVTNQQEARTMCRVILRVIGKDYSEYEEETNE